MVLGTIFEMTGAIAVGARTAETIKNGIIPATAFKGDAGVQMLAFTCALAGASMWVMWCTRHSAHVSSTYSLISSIAGVGVATVGAAKVQWGWNNGKGLGAIFAGLGMAPAISAGFGATIFMLIKVVVHMRKDPAKWSVYTAPFFFLVAGTVCTLSIVYKGSPSLGLSKKPAWYIAAVTLGTGSGVAVLSALFFVPFIYCRVIKRDNTLKGWEFIKGPLLFRRPAPVDGQLVVPNFAHVQEDDLDMDSHSDLSSRTHSLDPKTGTHDAITAHASEKSVENERAHGTEAQQLTYKQMVDQAEERFHAKLRLKRGPLGWAMRTLHNNPMGAGEVYERKNMLIILKRIPAMITVGALYGLHYDIHAAQAGVKGTPEGDRMDRVFGAAKKYGNEVEYAYSFIQVLTACTASFAHGANDIGNSVGPWAVIYGVWSSSQTVGKNAKVPLWQLAVLSLVISLGLITYGYNIMRVMGSKLTYHSPSRGMYSLSHLSQGG
jgi:sodium-dependent phosphate transporter